MGTARHYDLIIVGAGSGNTIIDERFAALDVAVIEERRFGGTCLNVGCIPTKMLAYTAEVAAAVDSAGGFDLDATLDGVGWGALHERCSVDSSGWRPMAASTASMTVTMSPSTRVTHASPGISGYR